MILTDLSNEEIKKLDNILKKDFKKIKSKSKSKSKLYGGTINDELSLEHIPLNKNNQKNIYNFLHFANEEIIKFKKKTIGNTEPHFKLDIFNINKINIGKFHIRSVSKPGHINKLILCIYDINNDDLIHISVFETSFIHITFTFNDDKYQLYYKIISVIKPNEWILFLIKVLTRIKFYLFHQHFPLAFFNYNTKWRNLLENPFILSLMKLRLNCLIRELYLLQFNFYKIMFNPSTIPIPISSFTFHKTKSTSSKK